MEVLLQVKVLFENLTLVCPTLSQSEKGQNTLKSEFCLQVFVSRQGENCLPLIESFFHQI